MVIKLILKMNLMNKKILYALPALAAVVALMFVVVTPHVLAEPGADKMWKTGAKFHKHGAFQVEGFVGSIPITEDSDKSSIKDQITVSLSEAAQGLDVQKGKIGIVANENGDKFVVWKLISVDRDADSETATITIHIVDAGDAENKAEITKEIDHSFKYKEKSEGESKSETSGSA